MNTMKHTITAALILLALGTSAQNVTRDSQGNYHAIPDSVKQAQNIATDYTYTDKDGKEHVVYVTKAGDAYYVLRVSAKTGKTYRYYLKP